MAMLAADSSGVRAVEPPASRHVIYLHGRIVQEQQSARPRHPEFGYYELEKILDAFRNRGFVVSGEMRPKAASVSESADRVAEQIRRLLESGVPADHVTVVGASLGADIALLASARLQNPELRFCLLGACLPESIRAVLAEDGKVPSGHVLVIREASDDLVGPCPEWREDPKFRSTFVAREIVLKTGLSHGFLYRPLPEWVKPVVEWAIDER
jgi:pimeloyl-ACP methyl ester carboxylesterase